MFFSLREDIPGLGIIGTRLLREGVNRVVCMPEEIRAMVSGGIIFFNAVLRQTID